MFKDIHLTHTQSLMVKRWLEEIARKKQIKHERILQLPGIKDILNDKRLSPHQKGDKLYNLLYRIRYPVLSGYQDKFKKLANHIYHKTGAKLRLPDPCFECNEIIVEPKEKLPDVKKFKKQIDSLIDWKPILK